MNTSVLPQQPQTRDFPTLRSTPPDSLRITIQDTAKGPVVELAGYLDLATTPMLKAACTEVLRGSVDQRVAADLEHVSFCDCTGLNTLLHIHRLAEKSDGWLRLCGAGATFHKVLRITGLAPMLRCYASAADAFSDVAPGGRAESRP
ncbi:anti-sigma B factor antagonist [Catenulispora sp. EB89]|uniref:STAS domain-containing protein n=1 Tax=Catenulispora sp. EB89 TaxID=3156257 RepID=UPI003512407E